MTTWPSVELIILNWNARHFLAQSIPDLLAQNYPHFTITIVDNGSDDDSLAWLATHYPTINVIASQHNLGFAGGNNLALQQLTHPFAILVNPDMNFPPNWLQEMIRPFLTDDQIGLVGCKLYYAHNGHIQHAGGLIRPPRAVAHHYGVDETDQQQHNTQQDVDYLIGAALAIRQAVINDIGLLDDNFFLYYEDADFCFRARAAGWRVVYTPTATAIHHESPLANKGSDFYLRHMMIGRWRFLLKHYPIDLLLGQTIPAEQAWLAQQNSASHYAAAWGYATAIHHRGLVTMTPDQEKQLLTGLLTLWQTVWSAELITNQFNEALWTTAAVEERPFTSTIPLLGPLITTFRHWWLHRAAHPFIQPQHQAQNKFNHLLTHNLAHISHQLEAQKQQLTQLERQIKASKTETDIDWVGLRAELDQTATRVNQLAQRLTSQNRPS
ncbi:MAG TPA: glycosyltransferase family 2 protein [Anaerolineae bacterium]|nr:glycosyltransferase family 2 protein [Anaerolineae bacterium]